MDKPDGMERSEALSILAAMQDLWDYREIGEFAKELWIEQLREYDFELAKQTLRRLQRTAKWRPAPAEFAEMYRLVLTEHVRAESEERKALESAEIEPADEIPPEVLERMRAIQKRHGNAAINEALNRIERLERPANEEAFGDDGLPKPIDEVVVRIGQNVLAMTAFEPEAFVRQQASIPDDWILDETVDVTWTEDGKLIEGKQLVFRQPPAEAEGAAVAAGKEQHE